MLLVVVVVVVDVVVVVVAASTVVSTASVAVSFLCLLCFTHGSEHRYGVPGQISVRIVVAKPFFDKAALAITAEIHSVLPCFADEVAESC